jgi:hypothetical protein
MADEAEPLPGPQREADLTERLDDQTVLVVLLQAAATLGAQQQAALQAARLPVLERKIYPQVLDFNPS